ncbi:MAG: hypothetical protein ACK5N4_25550 [Parabacteroides gordonii]|uniref:hypothetical protein n=1 Tax=Parabacteroides gordonii TaxID=574930 RepID=UPI003A83FF66
MNVFKLCVAAVFCFMVASCSNEDLENVSVPDGMPRTKSVENTVELSTVAQLLASIEIDQAVMNEVKAGVERSRKYGLDEEYRFTDMLKPSLSKIQRSSESSVLLQKMADVFNAQQEQLKLGVSSFDFFNCLSDNDIQIYWPFSEKWDGYTQPILLYATDDNNRACKIHIEGGIIDVDTISTTREFMKNNTVWIISINETSYDELPDFENGEYVNKDGVFFYSEIANAWLNKMHGKSRLGMMSPVHIGEIMVYDKDGSGGPEIYFMWGHAGGGMGLPIQGYINSYRLNLSDNEVKVVKQINLNIQPNWTSYQKTNALIILEKDGGKDKTATRNLIYTNPSGMTDVTVPIDFKYERRDEWLYDGIFERSKIFSSANRASDGSYKQYHGSGIYFTLPTPGFN